MFKKQHPSGSPLEPDSSFTLAKAIEQDIGHFIEDLQEQCSSEGLIQQENHRKTIGKWWCNG
jgi:hypothetical protein